MHSLKNLADQNEADGGIRFSRPVNYKDPYAESADCVKVGLSGSLIPSGWLL